jgi:hypothetical protein
MRGENVRLVFVSRLGSARTACDSAICTSRWPLKLSLFAL